MILRTSLTICCFAITIGLAPAQGAVTADFDGLNSNLVVDGFYGIPGDGWSTEWRENFNATGPAITSTVLQSGDGGYIPLETGSGPYLSVQVAETTMNDVQYSLTREHDSEGVDMSSPHRIEFLLRIDEDVDSILSTFTQYRDRYMIFDGPGTAATASSKSTWQIFCYAAEGNMAPASVVKKWSFLNGGNSSTGTIDASMAVDTGVPIVTGGVYAFTIDNYPEAGRWSGSVTQLGTSSSFTKIAMGWRDNQPNGSFIHFSTRSSSEEDDPYDLTDDVRAFSVDSIRITPIDPLGPPGNRQTVSAHFDGGNTDTVVDAFQGMRGDGWEDAWAYGGSNTTSTPTVVMPGDSGFDELKTSESGAYLRVVNSHEAATSYAGVRRSYEAYDEGIDWSRDHRVQFSLRIDEDLSQSFSDGNDRYQISDLNHARFNANESATWLITSFGGTGSIADYDDVGVWVFYDGEGIGGSWNIERNVPSTVAIVSGEVYDFTIEVDTDTHTYVATVSNDSYGTFTTDPLGWRRSVAEIGGYLLFDTRSSDAGETRAFSVDSIIISQTPQQPGDADGDGSVNAVDARILASHWLQEIAGGASVGDFNGDGRVDDLDASILAANWQGGTESVGVPEPGTFILLVGGLVLLMWRRQRKA
ncbi:MAG: PEP-CTERM sorting domain-containing protein [Pirellulales bacterium]|nr:PEP-CTERM sorting domain-containing protein [Pirellulales bacterium]